MLRWFAKKVHSAEDATFGWLRRIHPVLGLLGYLVFSIVLGMFFSFWVWLGFFAALITLSKLGRRYKEEDWEL